MDVLQFNHPTTGLRMAVPVGKVVAVLETGGDQCELLLADGQLWPVSRGYEDVLSQVTNAFAAIRANRKPAP